MTAQPPPGPVPGRGCVGASAGGAATVRRAGQGGTTRIFALHLSRPGAVVALLFFAFSLQPSMLPRTFLFQGLVSGITVVIGYALGVAGQWAWSFLGLPQPRGRAGSIVRGVLVALVAVFVLSAT